MARPTQELMDRLYAAKRDLHATQRALPIEEKIRHVIALQHIDYTIRRQRGERLESWQRPWDLDR